MPRRNRSAGDSYRRPTGKTRKRGHAGRRGTYEGGKVHDLGAAAVELPVEDDPAA